MGRCCLLGFLRAVICWGLLQRISICTLERKARGEIDRIFMRYLFFPNPSPLLPVFPVLSLLQPSSSSNAAKCFTVCALAVTSGGHCKSYITSRQACCAHDNLHYTALMSLQLCSPETGESWHLATPHFPAQRSPVQKSVFFSPLPKQSKLPSDT